MEPTKIEAQLKTQPQNANKKRSKYAPFTENQTSMLCYFFEENPCPFKKRAEFIAMVTGLTLTQVRNWFNNRRRKTAGYKVDKSKRRSSVRHRRSKNVNELESCAHSSNDTKNTRSSPCTVTEGQSSCFHATLIQPSFILGCFPSNYEGGFVNCFYQFQELRPIEPNHMHAESSTTTLSPIANGFSIDELLKK